MKNFHKIFYFSNVSKSYRTLAFTAILGAGLGLSACSSDPKTAGGGPSGTEAGNAITAQILTDNLKPAALAYVKLVNSESLDAESDSYAATADSNGNVNITGIANGSYILEARQGSLAIQKNITLNGSDVSSRVDTLEKMVSVAGSITANGEDIISASGIIKVRGLDHSAPVENGSFKLDSLPAGHLDLVFIPSDNSTDTVSTYVQVYAGKSATTSTFAAESNSLLLDDFEDGNSQHRFGPMYFAPGDGAWWYNNSSEKVIETRDSSISKNVSLSNENGNTALHIAYDFSTLSDSTILDVDGNSVTAWASLGVQIGSNNKTEVCYDLASVDSIAFKAKGSGNVKLQLIDNTREARDLSSSIDIAEVNLNATWIRYSFDIANYVDSSDVNIHCITMINWVAVNDVEFWLDDIELVHGDRISIWEK